MQLKLIRHTFPDDPSWELVHKDVPIGTIYELVGYDRNVAIMDTLTNKIRKVECFIVERDGNVGYMPTIVFEPIERGN